MAETLVELVAKITADATELKQSLSEAEGETEASSKKMAASLQTIGKSMVVAGAAITAAMGLITKSAIDEEVNIKRLGVALKGVGINYDDVKDSLEGVISATQRKTGIADSDQRDVLGRLILVTKDYNKALNLLPLALDLAAAGQLEASTAATYLSQAYLQLEGGASEIGIRIGQATVKFKNLDEVQKLVGGTAKATLNPFNLLTVSIGDMTEEIGTSLIPAVRGLVDGIVNVLDKVKLWATTNPELSKSLTMITLGTGGVLALTGGIILLMPQITKLIAGFRGVATAVGIANGSLLVFSLSVAGILAGLALLTYGITYITDREKAWNDVKMAGMRLNAQQEKYMKGEVNNYKELLAAYIPMIEAYILISNAKAEDIAAQRNWITHAKEGLTKLNELDEAMKDSTKTVSSMADAYDPELVKAQEEVIKSSQKLQDEQLELNKRFSDLLLQVYYNESAASKYGLTIGDVYQAMFRLGYKTEDIRKAFLEFGTDTNYTQILLDTLGLSVETVAGVLGKLKETTDANAASFKKMGEAALIAADNALKAAAATVPGGGFITPWGVIVGRGERALGPGEVGNRQEYIGGQGLTGRKFASGGIVTQPTLGMVGEAGPEAIIPLNEVGSMGGVTVNFTQPVFFDREDTMNRFVQMIRQGIQRQDRLRFGGAYSG